MKQHYREDLLYEITHHSYYGARSPTRRDEHQYIYIAAHQVTADAENKNETNKVGIYTGFKADSECRVRHG